ncbi:MAG TPA: YiiD C-terminal domain-containing protein [Solimonas sp.]|nr:YiiD C-terminal domain-containing protein [Solimonas sp.]
MDLAAAKHALENGIKFVANCGLKVVELRRGYVKCAVPFAGNGNHIGTMYAGALFTVAEIPGGALFLSSFDMTRYAPIVKEMNLRFLKPAKSDVTIEVALSEERIAEISAEADANGKAEFTLEGEIKSADGTVVAVSHGVYQIRSLKRL